MKKQTMTNLTRRNFVKSCSVSGATILMAYTAGGTTLAAPTKSSSDLPEPVQLPLKSTPLNLKPARWIWYPSQRCLQNTFVLFRKVIDLKTQPIRTRGWILADSRYLLLVNGQRVQWGPAPADPRWPEADPLDLTSQLQIGKNVIAAQVLFYGQGDGTWPIGKPGFIFWFELEFKDAKRQLIVSDSSWQAHLARCWPPGQFKRWYLRSLQEVFDARLYPTGWTEPDFKLNADWLPAMELNCPADKPSICSTYNEYLFEIQGDRNSTQLRARSIPLLNETFVPVKRLVESLWIKWKRPAAEYFECLTPNAFEVRRTAAAQEIAPNTWLVKLDSPLAAALTFEFVEQIVGWPYFTIEAPAGTVVELLVHEAHQPGGPALLNTHFHSWTRFICKEGENKFETYDFESLRWLQLHIRGTKGRVTVKNVGVRRRLFPWSNPPHIHCSDALIQKLMNASINTLYNAAQETLVDGMARERQQYSGDVGHQLHALFYTFGETRLPARYLNTFSQGITYDGFFLDCWPAYDRLARIMERQLQLTPWGPLLDHGVGFNFDCFYYYLYTGDVTALGEVYPRLIRFLQYLIQIQSSNGLLPVEDIGLPAVWIDHDAYPKQRHKQCAFNLYAAAMAMNALTPLCRAVGDEKWEKIAFEFGRDLLKTTQKYFWNAEKGLFINNQPWLSEENEMRLCDRSLATAILFNQCPGNRIAPALKILADCPPEMGLSYPANAGWRLWALAQGGRIDSVLNDLRTRWGKMQSVHLNNTLQESWQAEPDSGAQWSHCPVAPLYVLFMSIVGIQPLEAGFQRFQIRPQLGDLNQLELTAYTIKGPIRFNSEGMKGNRQVALTIPSDCTAELVLNAQEAISTLKALPRTVTGNTVYQIVGPATIELNLNHT